jgi:hypothetical protein
MGKTITKVQLANGWGLADIPENWHQVIRDIIKPGDQVWNSETNQWEKAVPACFGISVVHALAVIRVDSFLDSEDKKMFEVIENAIGEDKSTTQ